MQTTQVPYKLLQIQCFMSELSTLKLIVSTLEKHMMTRPLLPDATTDPQIADIFTKALPRVKHQFFVNKLMLGTTNINMRRGRGVGGVLTWPSPILQAHNESSPPVQV